MTGKTVIIIGRHPLAADARRQYAGLGYSVSSVECLGEADMADIPDELFFATTSEDADPFAEDTRNINAIRSLAGGGQITRNIRIHLLLHCQDTFTLIQKNNILEGVIGLVDIYPFTIETLWGQRLFCGLEDCPPADRIPIDKDSDVTTHLVIFGMNPMAESIARHAALTCHYPNFTRDHSLKTRITIIDGDIETRRDMFINKNSALFENSCYRFIDLNETGKSAVTFFHQPEWVGRWEDFVDIEWEFVNGGISDPVMRKKLSLWATSQRKNLNIVLCQENAGENISGVLQLPKEVEQNTITTYVRLSDSSMSGYLAGKTHLFPFGMKDVCHDVRLPLLAAAKIINHVYDCCYRDNYEKAQDNTEVLYPLCIDRDEAESSWGKLSSAKKWSNIYNALTLCTKMRSLGHAEEDWESFFSMSSKEIALIAEIEHNRWNVEELLLGFRPADEQQRKEIDEDITLKREYRKKSIHYDIRAYRDLRADDTGRNVNTYDICLSSAIPLIADTFRKEVDNA